MKEIKLWEIFNDSEGKLSISALNDVRETETENQLEEIIVRSPELLLPDLKFVGRQTETSGGPLDLLGVDSDGNLAIFELKRGTLTRDAVAQVVDYASFLAELSNDELSRHISERSGRIGIEKIDDFRTWYQEQFSSDLPISRKIRIFLIGLGADDRTRRMVSFLANSELDISLITFYGFKKNDSIYLARHVEVQAKVAADETRITKQGNLEKLKNKLSELGIGDHFFEIGSFFRTQLSAYEYPSPSALSYSLVETTETGSLSYRAYVSLYMSSQRGKFKIYLHPRAIEAAGDIIKDKIVDYKDKIHLRDNNVVESLVSSASDWEKILPFFEIICPAILEGWKKKREQIVIKEHQEATQGLIE
ncbi:MAG: DUF91 domain-containing protein [Deltaproteobacteria bacterium]|nr:DUF91 domain-containing protein [Deltaproteobacteria bacterium]